MSNDAKTSPESSLGLLVHVLAVLVLLGVPARVGAGQAPSLEGRFRGVTANMTPEGLELRIDVLRWSSEAERRSVVDRLTGAGDAEAGLADLPTVGYVWPADLGVGYALKYAHQVVASDGSERITLVTDRRLGTFGRETWQVAGTDAGAEDSDVSVVELRVDGDGAGSGTTSLAAGWTAEGALVSLEVSGETPRVIDGVTREMP